MAIIERKKKVYSPSDNLFEYLDNYKKITSLFLSYEDLKRHSTIIALYDDGGEDTLWVSVYYGERDSEWIHAALVDAYLRLKGSAGDGVRTNIEVDRIDLCTYGNTNPYRVRLVNKLNDNFDYFYIKRADASRIYGLEFEDLLSPNRVNYLVSGDTLIEEHIAGVPGFFFAENMMPKDSLSRVRIAKEFVKFNERCVLRLLGDMHSSNFVLDITPDFEFTHYRIRPIDFDQQAYEGRKKIYLPQFFKQNLPFVALATEHLTQEMATQYQQEEHALMARRAKYNEGELAALLKIMKSEELAPTSHLAQLKQELTKHWKDDVFLKAQSMGELVEIGLLRLT